MIWLLFMFRVPCTALSLPYFLTIFFVFIYYFEIVYRNFQICVAKASYCSSTKIEWQLKIITNQYKVISNVGSSWLKKPVSKTNKTKNKNGHIQKSSIPNNIVKSFRETTRELLMLPFDLEMPTGDLLTLMNLTFLSLFIPLRHTLVFYLMSFPLGSAVC